MTERSLKTALSRWENGHTTPDPFYRELLTSVLGLPDRSNLLSRTALYESNLDHAVDRAEELSKNRGCLDGEEAVGSPLLDDDQVITGYVFGHSYVVPSAISPSSLDAPGTAEDLRARTAGLMALDFQRGGGHVGPMLHAFFVTEVVPAVRECIAGKSDIGVFSAAAEVAQLLGWAAYDGHRHRVAARYFVLGLRLASEAHDHLLGARLLANLSHQYTFLRQPRQALTYARAAQSVLRGRGTPAVETMCVMMEARALAISGEPQATAAAIVHAETLLNRRSDFEPSWISYYDPAELAGDAAHAFTDLGGYREVQEFTSAALSPTTPIRTRGFIQFLAAQAALVANDHDRAASIADDALRTGASLLSVRHQRYVADFRAAVAEQPSPQLLEVLERHATQSGQKPLHASVS
ncbi:hypothetical protein ACIGO9_30410 [Nocardia asteroides]|uniref:hypothetical protein n=1 Tax=Nocardia asteroides TaxID=1824 RepID=UPI0037C9A280